MGWRVIRILACLSLLFFLVPVTYVRGPEPPKNNSQIIKLEPIAFDSSGENRTHVGRLEFLAGWRLSSDNHDFGGVSAMLAMPDNRFFLLSDAGVLMGFTLDETNDLALRPFIAPLPDGPPLENKYAKKNWDAESLITDPATGQFWVGYERYQGIYRYGPSFARKEAARAIPEMQKWPQNGGPEAMLRLPADKDKESRFIIFSESADDEKGGAKALIFSGDPAASAAKPQEFSYAPPRGYNITDAAILSPNQAILLHRRLSPLEGWSAILSIGKLGEIKPGGAWTSQIIARLKSPLRTDNMEALAVTREGSDVIIWIASDDNFNGFQDTLLMKFRLNSGRTKPAKNARRTGGEREKAEAGPGFSSIPK